MDGVARAVKYGLGKIRFPPRRRAAATCGAEILIRYYAGGLP